MVGATFSPPNLLNNFTPHSVSNHWCHSVPLGDASPLALSPALTDDNGDGPVSVSGFWPSPLCLLLLCAVPRRCANIAPGSVTPLRIYAMRCLPRGPGPRVCFHEKLRHAVLFHVVLRRAVLHLLVPCRIAVPCSTALCVLHFVELRCATPRSAAPRGASPGCFNMVFRRAVLLFAVLSFAVLRFAVSRCAWPCRAAPCFATTCGLCRLVVWGPLGLGLALYPALTGVSGEGDSPVSVSFCCCTFPGGLGCVSLRCSTQHCTIFNHVATVLRHTVCAPCSFAPHGVASCSAMPCGSFSLWCSAT